jgi:hypothetical protein
MLCILQVHSGHFDHVQTVCGIIINVFEVFFHLLFDILMASCRVFVHISTYVYVHLH